MIRSMRTSAAVLAAILLAPSDALAQAVDAKRQTFKGRVAEIFANRFILATDPERLLVEPADPAMRVDAAAGDTVSVEGERFGAVVKATRVERLQAAATPPPALPAEPGADGVLAVVRTLGLTPVDAPVTKKHHIEVLARMADGRSVYVSFDRAGRLWEIEDAAYDRDAATPRNLARADYDRLARAAGFMPTGGSDERRRHVELEATNRAGERLALHIDRAGYIYKQVWLR
jgi:hypothetical protein